MDIFLPPGRSWTTFHLEWGTVSGAAKLHGMCGKDYQPAMVVVEGGDVFAKPRVVKLAAA